MAVHNKPLPVIDHDSRPFWEAARRHELMLQRCNNCKSYIFYPRAVCPTCMSDELAWEKVSGQGSVYSYTVVHRAPAAFADDVPYVVAIIQLAEGPRMLSHVIKCPPAQVRIGMPVQVVFEDVNDEITLPKWEPAP